LYQKALDAGSSGGKLLGAGAGGFVLFFVEDNKNTNTNTNTNKNNNILIDEFCITYIDKHYECDTFFPLLNDTEWKINSSVILTDGVKITEFERTCIK
jgi:hypothetical protein